MMEKKPNKSSLRAFAARTLVATAIALAPLTACGHCPPVELFDGEGDRFVDIWQVENVRVVGTDGPPVNVGGIFALTRTSNRPIQFGMIPSAGFSEINDEWKGLELAYEAGSESKGPPQLIAGREVSKTSQSIQQDKTSTGAKNDAGRATYGKKIVPVEPDVLEEYFLGLKNGGTETLNGSMEINGNPNFITVFSIGEKETPTEGLLIFYCETERCDHSGMIYARPRKQGEN